MAKSDDDLFNEAIPIDQLGDDDNLLSDAIPIDQLTDDPAPPKAETPAEIELADEDNDGPKQEIRTFDTRKKDVDEDSKYNRKVNSPGTGASRAKTFVAKLRLDAIEHLDHQINDWLDAHPHYEIKHAVSVVGELTGKIKEPALFMTVFY